MAAESRPGRKETLFSDARQHKVRKLKGQREPQGPSVSSSSMSQYSIPFIFSKTESCLSSTKRGGTLGSQGKEERERNSKRGEKKQPFSLL